MDTILNQIWKDFDLLVIDNSPIEEQAATVAALVARLGGPISRAQWSQDGRAITLLQWPHNPGPGAAFAFGARYAQESQASHVWFLDQDMRPHPSCLQRLLQASQASPPVIAIPARKNPGTGFHYRAYALSNGRPAPVSAATTSINADVDLAVYSGVLLPTSFVSPNLIPEDFFIDWDDLTMCLRLRKAGRRIIFVPSATAEHESGTLHSVRVLWWRLPVAIWPTFRYYYIARNRIYYHRELRAWHKVGTIRNLVAPLATMALLMLWGRDRMAKLRNIKRGIQDGRASVVGKRPERAIGSPPE